MDEITTFVTNLAMYPRVPLMFNQYFDYDDAFDPVGGPLLRQQALNRFMRDTHGVEYALIGLAPGYAGARFSGVPFVDENYLTSQTGLRYSLRSTPWAEASATVVRNTITALGIEDKVTMWNALPFHPFELGKPLSNRTPTKEESDLHGLPWLARFLELMKPGIVIPVGRAAERALSKLDIDNAAPYVRHPSFGGDTEFARGLLTITRGNV